MAFCLSPRSVAYNVHYKVALALDRTFFPLFVEFQGPNEQGGAYKMGVISNLVELSLCTLGVPLSGIGVRLGGTTQARLPESPNNSRKISKAF